jgi:flagellar protein FliL
VTVVPDAAGRRVGGTGAGPLERPSASRPAPVPEPDEAGKKKGRARRKEDPKPEPAKGKAAGKVAAVPEEGEKKKGGKKKLIIIAVVLVLVLGLYMVKFRKHTPIYKAGEPVPNGKVASIGTITANTADGHLVQAGIDLQLTVVANSKEESADAPQFTNAAIADLANWTYAQLLTDSGRSGLQTQMLQSFQKILGPTDGAAQEISAVYFTSFILQ